MFPYIIAWLSRFDREEDGQGLVEYGLVIMLVSIVSIAALGVLGNILSGMFAAIAAAV